MQAAFDFSDWQRPPGTFNTVYSIFIPCIWIQKKYTLSEVVQKYNFNTNLWIQIGLRDIYLQFNFFIDY